MKIKLYHIRFQLLCLGLMLLCGQKLQAQESKNLIENPSFEKLRSNNKKAKNWIISQALAIRPSSSNPHEGEWCMGFYANSGNISSVRFDPVAYDNVWEYIKVKEGETYRLTYWLRADKAQYNVYPSLAWVTEAGAKDFTRLKDKITYIDQNWGQVVVDFTVPAGAEHLGLNFRVNKVSDGGYIYIDDVALVKTSEGSGQITYPAPKDLIVKSFQRELEVKWNKGLVEGMSWDSKLNGGKTITIDKPFYTFTDLEPNTQYKVEVRCHKGNTFSEFAEPKFISTKNYTLAQDDVVRIPYIRTINEFGACPQTIQLYFVNLYKVDAKITYLFDGQELKPQGKTLTFPKKGRHRLEVLIEEDEAHSWHLDYKLIIQ